MDKILKIYFSRPLTQMYPLGLISACHLSCPMFTLITLFCISAKRTNVPSHHGMGNKSTQKTSHGNLIRCPPYCRKDCVIGHHPLLQTILNYIDGGERQYKAKASILQSVISRYERVSFACNLCPFWNILYARYC